MTTATTATAKTENSDLWFQKFKPIPNPSATATWGVDDKLYGFATSGHDLAVVLEANKSHVWTLVEGDDGQYISAGYHLVNRLAHFICEVAFTAADETADYCDYLFDDDADDEE